MGATVEELTAGGLAAERRALAEALAACVADGASIGFLPPFDVEAASAWWEGVEAHLRSGARRLFVARQEQGLVGAVQLILDGPANGSHRAEIAKLVVHPHARRQGLGRKLMQAAEDAAVRAGRTLIVLDTRTGDPSETLYRGMGYQVAGVIPDYARSTDGTLAPTTILYKPIRAFRAPGEGSRRPG